MLICFLSLSSFCFIAQKAHTQILQKHISINICYDVMYIHYSWLPFPYREISLAFWRVNDELRQANVQRFLALGEAKPNERNKNWNRNIEKWIEKKNQYLLLQIQYHNQVITPKPLWLLQIFHFLLYTFWNDVSCSECFFS